LDFPSLSRQHRKEKFKIFLGAQLSASGPGRDLHQSQSLARPIAPPRQGFRKPTSIVSRGTAAEIFQRWVERMLGIDDVWMDARKAMSFAQLKGAIAGGVLLDQFSQIIGPGVSNFQEIDEKLNTRLYDFGYRAQSVAEPIRLYFDVMWHRPPLNAPFEDILFGPLVGCGADSRVHMVKSNGNGETNSGEPGKRRTQHRTENGRGQGRIGAKLYETRPACTSSSAPLGR
jgi:hypothetical protein